MIVNPFISDPAAAPIVGRSQWSQSRDLVSQFKAVWQSGQRLDARAFLARKANSEFRRSTVLDLAYEEFCLRTELGEVVQPDEFAAQFPSIHHSLARLLTVHRYMMANPELTPRSNPLVWPDIGEEFAGFELIEEIGRGAFARVFLASEVALSRRKVVAKIAAQGAGEAEIIAKLDHRYIVPIHSIQHDVVSGMSLICMPYQGRATLCDVVDFIGESGIPTGAAPLRDLYLSHDEKDPADAAKRNVLKSTPSESYSDAILEIGLHIAEALGHAHAQGICHQDLKPSNVLLTFDGEPLLLDFNLSADGRPAERVGGTLPYMAPEQIETMLAWSTHTSSPFVAASDLFAWGVLLYELLTGRQPFSTVPAESPRLWQDLLETRRQPVDWSRLPANADPALVDLIRQCLAFDAAARPESADQLVAVLSQSLRPVRERNRRSRLRRTALRIGTPALVMIGLASAIAYSSRAPASVREYEVAQRLFSDKEYKKAVGHLDRAISHDESMVEAFVLRAKARQAIGKYDSAANDFEAAYELIADPRWKTGIGICRALQGNETAAIGNFKDAIAGGFATAAVHNDLGYCYVRGGMMEKAIAEFSRALELDKDLQAAYLNRASAELNVARAMKRPIDRRAISDVNRAIELGPETGDLFSIASRVYSHASRVDLQYRSPSLEFLKKAILHGYPIALAEQDARFADFRGDQVVQQLKAIQMQPDAIRNAKYLVDPLP